MSCPFFKQGYIGVCAAHKSPHVPSIADLERFCFKAEFGSCPLFNQARLQNGKDCACFSSVLSRVWDPVQIPVQHGEQSIGAGAGDGFGGSDRQSGSR